jgi:hypothetical protein
MKNVRLLFALAALTVLLTGCGQSAVSTLVGSPAVQQLEIQASDVTLHARIAGDPKYAPQALMPELDALGNEGWELVHMQPVYVGSNADVLIHSLSERMWSNAYFWANYFTPPQLAS